MENHFCSLFVTRLDGKIPDEDLRIVKEELDIFSNDYDIRKKETALAVVDEMPQAYITYMVTKKIEGLSDDTLKQYKLHNREDADGYREEGRGYNRE